MRLQLVLVTLVIGLALVPSTALAAKSYSADRFDVDIAVQPDGSLVVTETVVFRFVGGPFTMVFRDIPTDLTDGIAQVTASMDGVALPPGMQAGQVEIKQGRRLNVKWHLEATSDSVHTFVLTYRAFGVIRQESDADVLIWQALPDDYDYAIASSTVTVTYPRSAALAGAPRLQRGSGILTTGASQATFRAANLRPDSPLIIEMRFAPGSLVSELPQWQARRMGANRLASTFIAAALGLFGLGLIGLWALWNRHRRETEPVAGLRSVTRPPIELSPALAGASRSGAIEWQQAHATLLDLARRGVLSIEESPDRPWYRRYEYVIRRQGESAGLLPHEQGLLRMLFETKTGMASSVTLSEASRKLSSRWSLFAEPLKQEMVAAGILSPERQAARRHFLIAGAALLALGGIGLIVTGILAVYLGPWPVAPAASLLAVGAIAMIFGALYSPLSDRGAQEAVYWRAFARFLRDVAKGKSPAMSRALFDEYTPFAASFGLADAWAAFVKRHGVEYVPVWFRPLAETGDGGAAAFAAMMSATSSSVGSGAGAAGAGAAGGGSSGAS